MGLRHWIHKMVKNTKSKTLHVIAFTTTCTLPPLLFISNNYSPVRSTRLSFSPLLLYRHAYCSPHSKVCVLEPLCLDDVRAYGRVPPLLECWSLQSVSYRVRVFNDHDLHLGKSAICKELIFFRDNMPPHMWKKFIVQCDLNRYLTLHKLPILL